MPNKQFNPNNNFVAEAVKPIPGSDPNISNFSIKSIPVKTFDRTDFIFDATFSNFTTYPKVKSPGGGGSGLDTSTAHTWTAKQTFQQPNTTTVGLVAKAVGSTTTNIQEWQDSSGTVLSVIDKYGAGIFGPVDVTNATHIARFSYSAANYWSFKTNKWLYTNHDGVGINLGDNSVMIWTDTSANNYDARIDSWNSIILRPGFNGGSATRSVQIISQNSGQVPFVVKGASSQSVDLTRWQDSSSTTVAKVHANGDLTAQSIIVSNKLCVTNTSNASTLGSVIKKMPVYDGSGTLLGYLPVYDSIT
jgi:hypothetical protein